MRKLSKEELSKIWERLIKSDPGPSNEDLMLILKDTDFEPLHERAWQQLLKSEPSHFHLREVIKYSCPSVREQAAQKLFESEPTNEDLEFICCCATLRDRAKEILRARSEATINVMNEIRSLTSYYR